MASLPKPLAELNEKLKLACEGKDEGNNVPNVSVIAADRNGNIIHSASYGTYTHWPAPEHKKHHNATSPSTPSTKRSSAPAPQNVDLEKRVPFNGDTVCWIASCTKLMSTVAALQCVERGLLTLDGDISNILPEFTVGKHQILKKVDDDKGPTLTPTTKPTTLRHLLTHSHGSSYSFSHPKMAAYEAWLYGEWREGSIPRPKDPIHQDYLRPALYESGEGWSYGFGTDWAGIAVARASGIPLDEFMSKNIWGPLGMKSTTFFPYARPDLLDRIASVSGRGDEGVLETVEVSSVWARPMLGWQESGGGGCYSTANDYIKLLISLMRNDGKLLKPATRDLMFQPQLTESAQAQLRTIHASPLAFGMAGNLPTDTPVSYGLGGILNQADIEKTGRSKGAIQWSGIPNLFWFMNPQDGICGFYGTQLVPTGDVLSSELYVAFEKAVNQVVKERSSSAKL